MAIIVNDSLQSNSPKSLDNKYLKNGIVPYATVAEANATVIGPYRHEGLTVLIGSREYWYLGGTADINLILKSTTNTINWGQIQGNIANQIDLNNALNQREPGILPGTALQYWRGDKTWQNLNSDIVTEGTTNLYFTQARTRQSVSAGTGISYNSSTGVISAVAGGGQLQSNWTQSDNTQADYIKNKPTIPAQFNPIAGTNVTITGSYPNMTFNSVGGGGSGCASIQFIWIPGGANNFSTISGSPTPPTVGATTLVNSLLVGAFVRVSYNGAWLLPFDPGDGTLFYTKVQGSNTLTFSRPTVAGDQILVETVCGSPGAGAGTVTNVGLTVPAAFSVSGSPVTSSGVLAITATGSTAQYIRGDGTLATLPAGSGSVTSVGLTMPTGFTVAGTPITVSGVLAVSTTLNGIVHGNGSGFVTAPVNLASEITGNLDVSHLNSGINASGATFWRGDGTWVAPPVTSPAGTNGLIQFNSLGTFGADANLFWDNTNKRLGIGTSSPSQSLSVTTANGGIQVTGSSAAGRAALTLTNDGSTTAYIAVKGSTNATAPGAAGDTVLATSAGNISLAIGSTIGLTVLNAGTVKAPSLAGSGTRMVVVDATGLMSTQPVGGGGSVTSIALTVPAAFSVSGSPITTNGTLAITATGSSAQYIKGDGTLGTLPTTSGTVTSVGLSITGTALTISGSPVTTTGTLALAFQGTTAQYVSGAGSLITFPTIPAQFNPTAGSGISITGSYPNLSIASTRVSSVGLSMPAAFSISGSPVTSSGTLTVTGAGSTSQYIRGDGSLATFPSIPTVTNIYNADGTIADPLRVVNLNSGQIRFDSGIFSTNNCTAAFNNTFFILEGRAQGVIEIRNQAGGGSSGYLIGRSLGNDDGQNFFIQDEVNNINPLTINTSGKTTLLSLQVSDGTQGTGKVFTSDASGNGSWQTPSGGGGSGVSSVNLTMPAAFSVSGGPITSSGTLAVTGAGSTSQYIRGDGSLATYINIYNADGSLTSTRVVNQSGNPLVFAGGPVIINGQNQNSFFLRGLAGQLGFQIGRSVNNDNADDFFIRNETTGPVIKIDGATNKTTFTAAVQIQDGTQAATRVFMSDASGNGAWRDFFPRVVLAGQDTAQNSDVGHFSSTISGVNTFRIGATFNYLSVGTSCVMRVLVDYTDENNNVVSEVIYPEGATSANLSTTGRYYYPAVLIRVKAGTGVGIQVEQIAGGVNTKTYDFTYCIEAIGP